jgi:hypothetical protein
MKRKTEFDKFDALMQKLIKVPHSTIKAKLDAEKQGKKRKLKRTSASGHVSDEKD